MGKMATNSTTRELRASGFAGGVAKSHLWSATKDGGPTIRLPAAVDRCTLPEDIRNERMHASERTTDASLGGATEHTGSSRRSDSQTDNGSALKREVVSALKDLRLMKNRNVPGAKKAGLA